MIEIPQIVEDLYYDTVLIPDPKDWPEYLGSDPLVIRSLYSFYYGLRLGYQLSEALQDKPFIPSAE